MPKGSSARTSALLVGRFACMVVAVSVAVGCGTSGSTGPSDGLSAGGALTGGIANDGTGASVTGGIPNTGTGGSATGGIPNTGTGGSTTGGVSLGGFGGRLTGGGGTPPGGGAQTGGSLSTGGDVSTGGVAAGGNPDAGAPAGSCSREVGSCSSPKVVTSDVNVGVSVTGYGREGDTEPIPMMIASMPSGGSRLAFFGTDENVYVATLDCDDKMVGTPFGLPGVDLEDIYADDNGGVVLLTRQATNGGTDNCGGGQLCGGTSSPCRTMWLVRFNASGSVEWETQVTNLSSSLAGYDNGARFVWWYQHHGRIAFDGSNYGTYFCIGITVQNGNCIDIHEGDRMQVVDASGSLVARHPDSFEVGCSHSWGTRLVWDPRTNHFVMVCATDNNCRIAQPQGYKTVAAGTCDDTLFGGDLVLSSTTGYWVAWSQGGQIRLDHFTTGQSDQSIDNAGSSSHPHLVSYGPNRMLLTWGSGSGQNAQVLDSGTGEKVGSQFTIDVNDHDFGAYKAYPDGSAAYPGSAGGSTIRIARVMPCSG